ncbi:MAG: hypothetical protein ACPMAQ_17170, partial [Phycisphaerae bacterium]
MRRAGPRILWAAPQIRPRSVPSRVLRIVALCLLAIIPYVNSLRGEFHFDDEGQIVGNEKLTNLTALLRSSPPARWLTFATFHLNARLHGLDFLPGWHAVNIALHVACVLALYWVLTRLAGVGASSGFRGPGAGVRGQRASTHRPEHNHQHPEPETRNAEPALGWPFIAAAIFAVHPLASEPVNYIQARSVILYAVFTLLALGGTIVGHRGLTPQHRLGGVLLALSSVALAAFSKEVGAFFAVAVPTLYLVLFVFPTAQDKPRLLRTAAAGGLAALAVLLIWLALSGALPAIERRVSGDLRSYWWGQMIVFWRYVLRAAVPLPSLLSVDHYVAYRPYRLADPDVLAAFAAIVALVILPAVWLARSRPALSLLLLMVPTTLAPYFVMTTWEMMVEYRFYLPLAAFCGLAGMALSRLIRQRPRLAVFGFAAALVTLGTLTIERNRTWRTDVSLWEDAVAKAPRKARAVNGLAWALLKDRAAPDPRRALELAERSFDPRFVDPPPGYNPYMADTLAEAYYANGMVEKAIVVERDILRRGWNDRWFRLQLAKFEAAVGGDFSAARASLTRDNRGG